MSGNFSVDIVVNEAGAGRGHAGLQIVDNDTGKTVGYLHGGPANTSNTNIGSVSGTPGFTREIYRDDGLLTVGVLARGSEPDRVIVERQVIARGLTEAEAFQIVSEAVGRGNAHFADAQYQVPPIGPFGFDHDRRESISDISIQNSNAVAFWVANEVQYIVVRTGVGTKVFSARYAEFDTPLPGRGGGWYEIDTVNNPQCFSSDTSILLPDGRSVPISSVREGDEVLAFDPDAENGRGGLVPRRVTAVHRSEVDHVLDVFGLGVTPGHATLCGDGPHEGRFRPVMDILIDDGAVVNEDGSLRRLSTNAPVGSNDDLPVQVALVRPFAGRDAKGRERRSLKAVELGWLRTGTRFIKPGSAEEREAAGDGTTAAIGDEFTLGEVIRANGWQLVTKGRLRGMIRQRPSDSPKPFPWGGDALPRPEDYVLAKSGVTLDELRQAANGPGRGIEPWRGGTGEPTRRPFQASEVATPLVLRDGDDRDH